jgi:hypothetical protein
LFSNLTIREPASQSAASLSRYVLPTDLSNALKQLNDVELDKLLAAALAEQKRRGRKPQEALSKKRQVKLTVATLTPSKINAVRAAFKAGVKPSQIARQFESPEPMCRKHWPAIANKLRHAL